MSESWQRNAYQQAASQTTSHNAMDVIVCNVPSIMPLSDKNDRSAQSLAQEYTDLDFGKGSQGMNDDKLA